MDLLPPFPGGGGAFALAQRRHSKLRGELRGADHWAHQALHLDDAIHRALARPPSAAPGPGRQKGPVPRIGGRDLMERRAGLAPAFPRRKRGVLP
ncbi:hypothetical protein [Streptomyces flaveolus]|uniref:hypothetical protein n=1 Tax=Streptomyces flaveolus TaxID=67297 RepID=UPI0036C85328